MSGPKCDCYSYNAQIGTTPEVVLDRPGFLPEGVRNNGVPVDACIADVIRHLWANDITTLGSCCGHGGRLPNRPDNGLPSIVLGGSERDYGKIRKLIAEVDDRKFVLHQWQWKLVEL